MGLDNEAKLGLLRIQLFTAAQTLEGEAAKEFWELIDDIERIRFMHDSRHPQYLYKKTD